MKNERHIFVYAGWLAVPELIGTIFDEMNARGNKTLSFEYQNSWLSNHSDILLDPDLYPYIGRQYLPSGKTNFGFLSDASPNRWGRALMKRREMIAANEEKRNIRNLSDVDYLIGVHDVGRVGALRFKTEPEGEFLSNDRSMAAPPWIQLRGLQNAALMLETSNNMLEKKWILQLLAPGSSLGGARPKATVQDEKGNLWIAKFPSKHDNINVGAWEKVVHDLAKECGLDVPESKLENFSEAGSAFLVKRFDREENGKKRIHFSSAMTMLGKTDGEEESSYLDILAVIKQLGSRPKTDMRELWSRIAFNVLVSNTDDHLRNHGFLLEKKAWKLSPLYDVNPTVFRQNLSLNITENDSRKDIDLVMKTAKFYEVDNAEAKEIIDKLETIIQDKWKWNADKYKIPKSEQKIMESAFYH